MLDDVNGLSALSKKKIKKNTNIYLFLALLRPFGATVLVRVQINSLPAYKNDNGFQAANQPHAATGRNP